ncbi:hypothetical protein ACWIX0_14205, partial [Helicobacter sp. T3_23-1059]
IYASSINHFDNNTAHIKFNLNFEVGIGNDDEVRESIRNHQQSTTQSTIKKSNYNQQYFYNNAINDTNSQQDRLTYFNKLEHIYNLAEAVAFLKTCQINIETLSKQNKKRYEEKDFKGKLIYNAQDDFLEQNPQIACKIAYIYYRFDLGNE